MTCTVTVGTADVHDREQPIPILISRHGESYPQVLIFSVLGIVVIITILFTVPAHLSPPFEPKTANCTSTSSGPAGKDSAEGIPFPIPPFQHLWAATTAARLNPHPSRAWQLAVSVSPPWRGRCPDTAHSTGCPSLFGRLRVLSLSNPLPALHHIPTTTKPSSQFSVPTTLSTSVQMCPICPDTLRVPGAVLRTLPCTHVFHAQCVDAWLVSWRGVYRQMYFAEYNCPRSLSNLCDTRDTRRVHDPRPPRTYTSRQYIVVPCVVSTTRLRLQCGRR
ncbi:hypothetical protein M427DRAFT_320332 [Gonapodya prolifera JEL478]|uniref:RING-type domain-containing protein n=1 Tax=Gonapodya prolifera (strain JEL478) TaxID=1344416 RepID=A0A139AGW2_GONPJ|nr:hypothetical protein M427DRAFT_320332 [Gonapodya prolifera JEL478]|eukprot:KXS15685.1 hypothetical protein M427DRAFT_320332 [Gonapodya prolifera JEL478]